jgi:hypothetical protein
MNGEPPRILVLEERLVHADLKRLVRLYFGDMVKYVVDVRRRIEAFKTLLTFTAEAAKQREHVLK